MRQAPKLQRLLGEKVARFPWPSAGAHKAELGSGSECAPICSSKGFLPAESRPARLGSSCFRAGANGLIRSPKTESAAWRNGPEDLALFCNELASAARIGTLAGTRPEFSHWTWSAPAQGSVRAGERRWAMHGHRPSRSTHSVAAFGRPSGLRFGGQLPRRAALPYDYIRFSPPALHLPRRNSNAGRVQCENSGLDLELCHEPH